MLALGLLFCTYVRTALHGSMHVALLVLMRLSHYDSLPRIIHSFRQVVVIRDGHRHRMDISEALVGDILTVEYGDILGADGIYVDGEDIICDESAQTGEAEPINKGSNKVPCDHGARPRHLMKTNMAYLPRGRKINTLTPSLPFLDGKNRNPMRCLTGLGVVTRGSWATGRVTLVSVCKITCGFQKLTLPKTPYKRTTRQGMPLYLLTHVLKDHHGQALPHTVAPVGRPS